MNHVVIITYTGKVLSHFSLWSHFSFTVWIFTHEVQIYYDCIILLYSDATCSFTQKQRGRILSNGSTARAPSSSSSSSTAELLKPLLPDSDQQRRTSYDSRDSNGNSSCDSDATTAAKVIHITHRWLFA